ncbi:MAG: MFS transporter, partial [Woeseiaceae bacterium]|nr:MFS transporter [Woeseiaceae bacterium]MDX2608742.1 MFS transporter [Woeseiaceae bacterium]
MAGTLALSNSSRVRYATGSIMYFAQGIPQGLLSIAIPAWLASEGVGAAEIASYLAVIVLPWAFKLVTGPLMDRYEFLPMGRRRPWVIGAQLGLSLSLLALMLVERPAEQIGLLMLIGVLINSFAATQDVAVDGMSIDLTPVREQGRLNAFMSFGKAIGWSVTAAVSGVLITIWGLKATAILAAIVACLPLLALLFIVERDGERSLPWTRGNAATVHRADSSFVAVFSGINKILWVRGSVVIMAIMFCDGLIYGYGQALMPIAAVNLFGYTTAQWSQLVAMMGLIGAVIALSVGPLIDRMGAKRMLFLATALVAIHALLISQTQHLWQDTTYVRVMLSVWVMMLPVVMVAVIALAMAICSSTLSATQFAIYMSVANLGHAVGSKIYGSVAEQSSYMHSYALLSVLAVVLIVVVSFHRHRPEETTPPGGGQKAAPRYTIGISGAEAGAFWSGAMRCPKCRADMEQIDFEGTEIDRCKICKGIWFDAGEIELMRDNRAAVAIDTGDASVGKQSNAIDRYPCPRCSGSMVRVVDPQQRHIWYETCGSCGGSFLDAGELIDLSKITIG